MPRPLKRKVTKAQVSFIEVLFIDCAMSTRLERHSWLDLRGYGVSYLDELDFDDATEIIDELKELRDRVWHSAEAPW